MPAAWDAAHFSNMSPPASATPPFLDLAAVRAHIRYKASVRELPADVAERMVDAIDSGSAADYPTAYDIAVFVPLPDVVYHTAPREARDAILRDGLIAHEPGDYGSRWLATGQPSGLYVGSRPDVDGKWAGRTEEWDVWLVRTSGLSEDEWRNDRLNPGCWSLVNGALTDRISLHSTHRW